MTNIEEPSQPYLQLLSESDAGSDEISRRVVNLFRDLYVNYPDPLSAPKGIEGDRLTSVDQRILRWLTTEHFIKFEDDRMWLTFTAYQSVRHICRLSPAYLNFFDDPASPPPLHPMELVLALLKTHFEQGRVSGRP